DKYLKPNQICEDFNSHLGGFNAVHRAVYRGDLNLLKLIHRHYKRGNRGNIYEVPCKNRSIFSLAAIYGDGEMLKYVHQTMELNPTIDRGDWTALHHACVRADNQAADQVLTYLLQNSVKSNLKIDALNSEGDSALDIAVHHARLVAIQLLVQKGAKITKNTFEYADKDPRIVAYLLANCGDEFAEKIEASMKNLLDEEPVGKPVGEASLSGPEDAKEADMPKADRVMHIQKLLNQWRMDDRSHSGKVKIYEKMTALLEKEIKKCEDNTIRLKAVILAAETLFPKAFAEIGSELATFVKQLPNEAGLSLVGKIFSDASNWWAGIFDKPSKPKPGSPSQQLVLPPPDSKASIN
ncbi:MAG: hypothetical protein K0Q74_1582, partial [Gammaproteobacteria bacterium]|nr:hypothetical protein [Gammaproteobacteria bacterium]